MSRKKLSQYNGRLDAGQIAQGMNAARRNARRLAEDAKLLLEAARYPTASALAILSIEESGKDSILRQIAGSPSENVLRDAWKNYRSHRHKNAMWILPDLIQQGAKDLTSLQPATDPSADHTAILDQVKQISFYTDCLGNAHWSEPEDVIDEKLAEALVSIATLFTERGTVTAKEVELWIEHMRPVYGASLEDMKTALLAWYSALRENGLWEEGEISAQTFVFGDKG